MHMSCVCRICSMCVSYQPSFWGLEFVTNAVVFSPRFARLAFQAGCGLKMRIASGKTMVNDNMPKN